MEISFEKHNGELILCYAPTMPARVDYISDLLQKGEEINLKNTYCVSQKLVREYEHDEDWETTFRFCIGFVNGGYIKLDSTVFGTDHDFFISIEISLKPQMFTAYRNISVIRKIDEVIDHDMYVGGDWESHNGISIVAFQELLKTFPKTAELDLYAHKRISTILKEFFPECGKYEELHDKFIAKRRPGKEVLPPVSFSEVNSEIELAQFSLAIEELEELLTASESIDEKFWQEKIHGILRLLYPKYILFEREVRFYGCENKKQPDFLMVDTNGFLDILEIKKADVRILTWYRNNYAASREFSGAVQQIEKYIYCLTKYDRAQSDVSKKIKDKLPPHLDLQIVNPQGILLLGRSNQFNKQQKQDFEILKRQYKHIADIMTYDDLVSRLKNVVYSLQKQLQVELS